MRLWAQTRRHLYCGPDLRNEDCVAMSRLFISYRRDDNPDAAGRICDSLRERFGDEGVFFDIDTIPLGLDFRAFIDAKIGQCAVAVVVIGDA